jgi:carboxyl-terminal processing protease
LPPLWICLLLWAPLVAQAADPPLAEIRAALARLLPEPPAEAALAGLDGADLDAGLRRVDPHARWFPTRDHARERGAEGGIGVGAALVAWDGRPVLAPYAEGPLARLGAVAPVRLESVDGTTVAGLSLAEVADRLHGTGPVRLGLAPGGGPRLDLEVVRGPYRTTSVELVETGGRRLVRLRGFVAHETRGYLADTLGGLTGDPPPLILDLRDSPGGDLYEAMDCAALFLPEGVLLAQVRDGRGEVRSYRAPAGPKPRPVPPVLWVGPGTASAAEVFAGILQHYVIATLVGQRTYGKCRSQTDLGLSDGSVLRLTNRMVLLPDGRDCTGEGLSPDLEVDGNGLLDEAVLLRASGLDP